MLACKTARLSLAECFSPSLRYELGKKGMTTRLAM